MWHVRLVAATEGHLIKSPCFSGLSTNTTFCCNCSNAPFTISTPPSDCLLASAPLKVYTAHFENHYSKVSDYIFEIHQLWQSGVSRVYSNCCCSCSFEPEIIKVGQLPHKMYSNNILDFQESTTILKAHTKKSGNLSYEPRMSLIESELNTCLRIAVVLNTWLCSDQKPLIRRPEWASRSPGLKVLLSIIPHNFYEGLKFELLLSHYLI